MSVVFYASPAVESNEEEIKWYIVLENTWSFNREKSTNTWKGMNDTVTG